MALNSSLRRLQFEADSPEPHNNSYRDLTIPTNRDFDLSLTFQQNELSTISHFKTFNDTTLRHALDETTIAGPDVKSRITEELTEVFYEVSQTTNPADALDTIGRFIQACCDSLEKINPWDRFIPQNNWLAEEANTWRLLYCLYLNNVHEKTSLEVMKEYEALSQKKLVATFFRTDPDIRLMQLIVDWLENCASYTDSAIPAASRAGSSLHWENTLHHLENGMSLFDTKGSSSLVTALDPDAPRRQKKNIHSLDQQDDINLCQRLFKELRCGRFEDAVSLCVNSGQMWRGLILQGQRLLHYPEEPQSESKFAIEGNPSRDLWKLCCMGLLTKTEENIHFKATIGVLCGNLPSVLPLCSDTWEDLLWAHLRTQIELRVDQYLKEHHSAALASTANDEVQDLLEQFEQSSEYSLHEVFDCVNALHKNKTETRYQEAQRHLILEQIDTMLYQASIWIETANFDLTRFLAHLVLILRQMGRDNLRNVGDDILKTYVGKLIEQLDGSTISPELIAHYTSTLPSKYQIEKYSQLMWLVEAKDDRSRVMEAGTQAGLDVQAAARETVKNAIKLLRDQQPTMSNNNLSIMREINDNSQLIIQRVSGSLEWFSFFPTQIPEAVTMSNSIIRNLVFKGDVDSATGVLSRLTQFCPSGMISQKLPPTSDALREHLCLKAYLEAINGYATWYRQHIGGRPRSPEPLPVNFSFTDKVHYEQLKAQSTLQQERWNAASLHQARHTKQLLYNVLLFPSGWLVDDVVSSDEENSNDKDESLDREKQLLALRKLCIPEIVLLLVKVLQSGDINAQVEAIRLSDILASELHQLYKLFSKHKLREVLHKIGESSLVVLENNRDPWGFETSNE